MFESFNGISFAAMVLVIFSCAVLIYNRRVADTKAERILRQMREDDDVCAFHGQPWMKNVWVDDHRLCTFYENKFDTLMEIDCPQEGEHVKFVRVTQVGTEHEGYFPVVYDPNKEDL